MPKAAGMRYCSDTTANREGIFLVGVFHAWLIDIYGIIVPAQSPAGLAGTIRINHRKL